MGVIFTQDIADGASRLFMLGGGAQTELTHGINNPALNGLTALAVPARFDLGGVSIEVEFLDAATGKRVAAAVDRKAGSKMKVWQGLSRWGDTRAAFRKWGRELGIALDTNPGPAEEACGTTDAF